MAINIPALIPIAEFIAEYTKILGHVVISVKEFSEKYKEKHLNK